MKTTIITGSSGNLGLAIAAEFAAEGHNLVLHYRSHNQAILKFTADHQGIKIVTVQADLATDQGAKKVIDVACEHYGSIDNVINNAGSYTQTDEWTGSVEVWKKTVDDNLISMLAISKYAALQFQKQQSGCLVNIASRKALFGHHEELAYSAAKAGVVNATHSYAKLLSPYARVNAVCPGAIESGYWLTAPKKELKTHISHTAHKRLITPAEIASVVVFFTSEAARMVTGQTLLVDGGNSLI